ncbi:hypothetical protein ACH8KY_004287 [Salmonella enterica subsp. enterica serovar Braenderup]
MKKIIRLGFSPLLFSSQRPGDSAKKGYADHLFPVFRLDQKLCQQLNDFNIGVGYRF